ncbi:MAG: DUF6134 family protein [Henriciella sp.]|nr:DUF6134 family protein [Henriciella sp.]
MIRILALALGLMLSTAQASFAQTSAQQTSIPVPWTAYDGAVIDFTVLRKGRPFGQHKLTFAENEAGLLEVTSDVDLRVKIGPITAFRYRLDSVENWIDGKLVSLTGKTNNDGRKDSVTVQANGDGLYVDGTEFKGEAPATIIPSSHWNRMQVYSDRMLSTESGEIIEMDVQTIGRESVQVGEQTIDATHYRLVSDLTVDLWYDDQSRWVKLAFEVRGQPIEYVLNRLY